MEHLQREVDILLVVSETGSEFLGETLEHHQAFPTHRGDRGETGAGEESTQDLTLLVTPAPPTDVRCRRDRLGQIGGEPPQHGHIEPHLFVDQTSATEPAERRQHGALRDLESLRQRGHVHGAFCGASEQGQPDGIEHQLEELTDIHSCMVPTPADPIRLDHMRLYLVRHGLTKDTGKVLTGRLPGVPLSDMGRLTAVAAGEKLAAARFAAIYTSPIQRCRETARLLADRHDLAPITERRLIEADYGTWSGRRLGDLYRLKNWDRLMAHPGRFRFPEGETLREVQVRAVAAVEDMAMRHGDEAVLAVSHADVIRVLLCEYLGMPLDLIHRLHVAPVSVSLIQLKPTGAVTVPVINQTIDAFEVS